MDAFDTLRRLAQNPQRRVEFCELCRVALHQEHSHLIEVAHHKLLCSCDACAILFAECAGAKYRRVPRQVRLLENFQMTDAEWDSFMIPINLAFFFQSSLDSRVTAFYPSPAGATESLLPLEAWRNILGSNPVLARLEADVEALLVNRVGLARGASRGDYFIVPIDACYRLVGLIRLHWRGLSGGAEVWEEIGTFFSQLRSGAQVIPKETHA